MPVYVHVIDHPDARVLVDTGMTQLHPAVADMDPRLSPLSEQDFDLAGIDIVVNTHLHFDHCGGNHLFAGKPIYVQRPELDDARSQDDYTIRDWVDAPGVRYVPVDGELELLPGVRLVPAPGHTRGSQVIVVETGARPVVVVGDTAVWSGELDEPSTEGQRLVRALDPELAWLSHQHEPWRPPEQRSSSIRRVRSSRRPTMTTYPLVPKTTAHLRPGQFWSIPMADGRFGCGRVLRVEHAIDWRPDALHRRDPGLGRRLSPSSESIAGSPVLASETRMFGSSRSAAAPSWASGRSPPTGSSRRQRSTATGAMATGSCAPSDASSPAIPSRRPTSARCRRP